MILPSFLAKRFVAGDTPEKAIEVVRELNQDGIRATLDLLGENVDSLQKADEVILAYRDLFQKMQHAGVDGGVSIKLTQLGLDFGLDACLIRTRQVLDLAKKHGLFVRIDMEGSMYTQATIDAFLVLQSEYNNVGLVLQAYLKRSRKDVELMIEKGASIRVCKGAYKESEDIAFQNMQDIQNNFKEMVHWLLLSGNRVGIATHDDVLIDWALAWTEEHKIDRSQFEFQMLYGLRRKKAKEIAALGYRVRSYVPYGTHWFPYFYRRLRERKENVYFVLKGLFKDS